MNLQRGVASGPTAMPQVMLRDPATGDLRPAGVRQQWVESVQAAARWTADVELVEHVHLPLSDPLEGLVLSNWISTTHRGGMPLNVRYDGSAWKRLELAPNRINLRPSGVSGCALWNQRGASLLVSLSDSFVRAAADECGVVVSGGPLLPLASIAAPQVYATLMAMRAEALAGCPTGATFGEGMGRLLLAQIWAAAGHRGVRQTLGRPTALGRSLFERTLACMRERLHEPLSLAELAAAAGMSPFHFARAFRQHAGKPPHQFLLDLRIERASALLQATDLPVAAIAGECGFDNQSHFARVFRRAKGTTPTQFRRS